MIKLSIIIPVYNAEPYIHELIDCLAPQITEEIEVICVDDGSRTPFVPKNDKIKLIRQQNKGVSAARNRGLRIAKGQYIAFVDADDLLAADYVSRIMKAVESEPDTVYLSWKSIDGRLGKIIQSEKDEFNPHNRCVWNRVFSKEYITGMKFDEDMPVAEDDDFLKRLPEAKSKTYISTPVYFYRAGVVGGLTDRKIKGEFREPDYRTQIVVYCGNCQTIGGIETFLYNWCRDMCKYYDIIVLYSEHMDGLQIMRMSQHVMVMRDRGKLIECNVVINIRLTDEIPGNIRYKKRIQMSHTCQLAPSGPWHWTIKQNYDDLIFVSKAAGQSFADQNLTYDVIPNPTDPEPPKKALLLVSATRLTWEKGEERMYTLAEKLKSAGIPFTWLVFSAGVLKKKIPEIVMCPPTLDVRSFFLKADYIVQLSDIESFCYTLAEALELGVPVLTTPIAVLPEIGFEEGKNGYTLPFDMKDLDVDKIYNEIPKFEPVPSKNKEIIKKWRKYLGNTKPKNTYKKEDGLVTVIVVQNYGDLELGRNMTIGEVATMRRERAILLINRGMVEKI